MRLRSIAAFAFACGWLACAAQTAAPGVPIDGIAAVLNGEVITRSEVEDAGRFAHLSAALSEPAGAGADCATLSEADRVAALQHVIDDRLLLASARGSGYPDAAPSVVAQAEQRYQRLAGGPAALAARLRTCGLDADTMRSFLARQASILAFLDDRLGAVAEPSEADIRTYYNGVFVPEARAQHLTPAPLESVRAQIAEILREQSLATNEDDLVRSLRDSAQIEIRTQPPAGGRP